MLKLRKEEIQKGYGVKNSEMKQKALIIRELIERAKSEADVGLAAILEKWDTANEHVLKQHRDRGATSLSILDKSVEV